MDKRPVGVLDSGLGGASTLIEVLKALPRENYIYYSDCGNGPYGSRSTQEIQALAQNCGRVMLSRDVKALLVACNTATSSALHLLRQALPMPVVGIEPAICRAEAKLPAGHILAMATEATVRQERYRALRGELKEPARVHDVPCPKAFVERIELGIFDMDGYDDLLLTVLRPYEGLDVRGIVLGCTHYPFIQKQIARYARAHFQGAPRFFDGSKLAAQRLKASLRRHGLFNGDGNGGVSFFTSGRPEKTEPLFRFLLQQKLELE
ncbi:MAG: glutamate racemase [Clostridiales bacterium]|nr:glutamate racemase [Clostridiales bacterium]